MLLVARDGRRRHRLPLARRLPARPAGATRSSTRARTCRSIFDWPTGPSWLYALTQGLHVNVGLVAIPFVLAKLWSVIPRLFAWPPVALAGAGASSGSRSRCSSRAPVFLLATGRANIQYWYVFGFNFVVAHYYGAIVFVALAGGARGRQGPGRAARVPRARRAHAAARRPRAHAARARRPRRPRRRRAPARRRSAAAALLASPAAGSLALLVAQRRRVDRRAAAAARAARPAPAASAGPTASRSTRPRPARGVTADDGRAAATGSRCAGGPASVALSREELLALPQRTHALPIACVEGWSTTQDVDRRPARRPRAAGRRAGRRRELLVESLQPRGRPAPGHARAAARSPTADALLALRVNGADLSLDHGYPARIIVPALPGVHNTKWVAALEFRA